MELREHKGRLSETELLCSWYTRPIVRIAFQMNEGFKQTCSISIGSSPAPLPSAAAS
jgi:hypothetical protein